MNQTIELGLDTFGDITDGPDGKPLHAAQVIRNLVDEAVLADEVGVDFVGVDEHHRADFAVSSPEMVLAAVASRTQRIRLGSAVTVLSSDDPIRVFQRFSTLDALSDGRAEVILGRGSFIESFPLFGFDLKEYEELFNEKLDLFATVLSQQPVTWRGGTRPPLENQSVYPKTESGRLTTWIGVGGTPQSVLRAAHYGLPMMLAIIGGTRSASRRSPISTAARSAREVKPSCRSGCIRTASSVTPTRKPGKTYSPTISACATRSAPSAAGRRSRAPISSARSSTGRSMSDRPRRWRARSWRPPRRSG
jgi:alkanesulfonate monooxygenase SsuD/methylene tetrahydromethanopterin reductase-like flavin-dependent oxidoreductase (luciferase family)